MCQIVHCTKQMLVRVFMTIILMIENLIKMILETFYNFLSFILQVLSLLPICMVFLLTSRLKCCLCGGGGACPIARGGTCDCVISALAIFVVFLIFRATGVLDKIFYKMGYAKAYSTVPPPFYETPSIARYSRHASNDSVNTILTESINTNDNLVNLLPDRILNLLNLRNDDNYVDINVDITRQTNEDEYYDEKVAETSSNVESKSSGPKFSTATSNTKSISLLRNIIKAVTFNEEVNEDFQTTVLFYLVTD